jgi:hypothetical protein
LLYNSTNAKSIANPAPKLNPNPISGDIPMNLAWAANESAAFLENGRRGLFNQAGNKADK